MKSYAIITLLGLFLRWSVSLFPYSGAGKSPMYGDYEAQRHWQEITVNLDISKWYINSTHNDLMYWGLDYPPLTAYHSFICGKVAKLINPAFVALNSSRGFESASHKLFMRYTVFVTDLLIYIPAAFLFCSLGVRSADEKSKALQCFSSLILYPGIYLIDYGHFQYNNVSLGLFILAVALIMSNYDILGGISFVFALNYKQMELYHALPIFVFYLGKYYKFNGIIMFIVKVLFLGAMVILAFGACWYPFLTDLKVAKQVLTRIFPFNRGVFEDKVASFWCSASIFFKFKDIFDHQTMSLICLAVTSLLLIPSCLHLLFYSKPRVFKYCLINCSLIFFLFSFHVHEKSILLVAIPVCFICYEEPLISMWFFVLSIVSMLPLLIKDGLLVAALCCVLLCLCSPLNNAHLSKFSLAQSNTIQTAINISYFGIFLLASMTIAVPPPSRFPDLYPVLISFYSCFHFCLLLLYFHYCQYQAADNQKIKKK